MIRINLLPGTNRESRGGGGGGGQLWLAAYALTALALCVILVFVYLGYSRTLNEELAQNRSLQQQITELQEESANIEAVRAELEESQELEGVVNELQRARFGPTRVLMELTNILTRGRGPTVSDERMRTIRERNPQAAVDLGWDTRRLWVTELQEEDRIATITGVGRSNDDVAEFLRRLSLSEFFEGIELVKTEGQEDRETGLVLISFELTCQVVY